MSGRIAAIIAQALVMGTGVVIKAFVEAYQKVAANPEAAKAAADAARRTSVYAARKQMSLAEAKQVLNFEKTPATREELMERFEKYHSLNDHTKGGSRYLQAKVSNARAAIEEAMGLDSASQEHQQQQQTGGKKPSS